MKLNNTNFNSKIFQFKNSKLNQIKINFKNFNYEWQFNTNSMNIDPTQIDEYRSNPNKWLLPYLKDNK